MQRTLDEWFADFQAIMFRGYFAGHDDAAGKYRLMENENAKLKALLRRFMDDVTSKPTLDTSKKEA